MPKLAAASFALVVWLAAAARPDTKQRRTAAVQLVVERKAASLVESKDVEKSEAEAQASLGSESMLTSTGQAAHKSALKVATKERALHFTKINAQHLGQHKRLPSELHDEWTKARNARREESLKALKELKDSRHEAFDGPSLAHQVHLHAMQSLDREAAAASHAAAEGSNPR
eukprot:TRINITY_DN102289_c0_g1_i1.p1 TRINITY_DN102289_c0_g1~~TRINITY_DN102289_c0_g1_i1.p1  ORF type:complete len:172 (+),score=53.87 TRINITY_DN102289_c0_g1_i1:71-586(+)